MKEAGKSFNKKITFPFLSEAYQLGDVRIKKYVFSGKVANHSEKYHFHHYTEVHFVEQGEMIYEIDGREVRIGEGAYLLIGRDCRHKRVKSDSATTSFHITFSPVGSAYEDRYIGTCKAGRADDDLPRILTLAERALDVDRFFAACQIYSLICALANLSVQHQESCDDAEPTDQRIALAKDFIRDHAYIPLNCSDVAVAVYLSVRHLERLFERSEGCTLKSYIEKERFDLSKKCIADPNFTITQISDYMGFGSVGNFSQFFKKHAGMCPKEYRDTLHR